MLDKEDIDSLIFDIEALNLNLLVANPLSQRGWELAIEQVTSLLKSKMDEELCPVCHGKGSTTDHHDPCTECGGNGKVS